MRQRSYRNSIIIIITIITIGLTWSAVQKMGQYKKIEVVEPAVVVVVLVVLITVCDLCGWSACVTLGCC